MTNYSSALSPIEIMAIFISSNICCRYLKYKRSRLVEALHEAGGRGKAEEIRKTNDYCILAVESGLDPE